jgi:subtilisin family serine protease
METVSRRYRIVVSSLVALAVFAVPAMAERLIVRTRQPYSSVRQKIAALGGVVTYEFRHANGLAVTIPDDKADALRALAEVQYAVRDLMVPNPRGKDIVDVTSQRVEGLDPIAVPADFFPYGSDVTDATPLQEAGFLGQGVVVGLIDSGVSASVPSVGPRVIGGENFVPGASEPGATSALNDPHGTWVACTIGANVAFGFLHTSAFAAAVAAYCTPAASAPCSFDAGGGVDAIPMVGQAPFAQFFALKVFPASGGGAPESRILQAMDRAIELKGSTLPNMRVVNMSLGGTTFFAGGDIEDELATSMAQAGITLVAAAGNTGPSGSTIGSPGTARNILTVGAASSPVNERILRDLQFGTGIGPFFRPDDNQQVADFSSRGPDADGRIDPDLVANGLAAFAQGADGSLSLVSGTSFSCPTVSGIAAVLYSANASATPAKIRAALIRSANASLIPTAKRADQGAGYVDAAAAKALLDRGVLPALDLGLGTPSVALNVLPDGIVPIIVSHFSAHVSNLRPAERKEFYFLVDPTTDTVRVTLSGIVPALPVSQQNAFFGDDLLFTVHSAKTSQIGATGDYLAFGNVASDQSFVFEQLDTGLMRITLNGSTTNAGPVSADITIEEVKAPLSKKDFHSKIAQGEEDQYRLTIAPGTASVTFRLSWIDDWGNYPTDDLDMILQAPDGTLNLAGATINSPEYVTIANPPPGQWTIFVEGATVFRKTEPYEIRVD